jgi:hypothetical protein
MYDNLLLFNCANYETFRDNLNMINNRQVPNEKIALLTKHGKEALIAPVFADAFNSQIIHTDSFDTDTLGSFDHVTQRTLSAPQAALKKAYLACQLAKCSQGMGSEGSINSLFGIGLLDEEFLAFVDLKNKIEIVACVQQAIKLGPIEAKNKDGLSEKLYAFDREQFWMLQTQQGWKKGLSVDDLIAQPLSFPVYLEPDFRAMYCPARQAVIIDVAKNLAQRLSSFCPKCAAVDFSPQHAKIKYLPCEICTLPSNKILPRQATCSQCGAHEIDSNAPKTASAFHCNYCNP